MSLTPTEPGLRVQKCIPSCGGSNPYTVYVFSGSKVIAEYDDGAAVGSPSREYIYAGAALLAKIDSSGTKYYHQDHLSNRLVTDSSGNVYAQMGHYPFGEKWYNATNDKLFFTTYERDSESGNDYGQARYNVSRLGRFSSPDPIAGSTSDPQSLNRYSYVRNMPVSLTDPLGLIAGCIPVAKRSAPDKDNESADDSKGHGPSASDEHADAGLPEPQGDCANATGFGGGGGTLDGIDLSDIPGGLIGNGESNNGYVVPSSSSLGFNSWAFVFGSGAFGSGWWNVTTGCDVAAGGGGAYCGTWQLAGDSEPAGGSEFDLYEAADPQGPGGADRFTNVKALARDKVLNNDKCRQFIEQLLNFMFGGPQTAQNIADRLDKASFTAFMGPQDPDSTLRGTTDLGSYSAIIYARGAALSDNNLAVTFIHETFHMGIRAKTDQQMWQATIGNPNITLPASATEQASRSWGQKLRDNCE